MTAAAEKCGVRLIVAQADLLPGAEEAQQGVFVSLQNQGMKRPGRGNPHPAVREQIEPAEIILQQKFPGPFVDQIFAGMIFIREAAETVHLHCSPGRDGQYRSQLWFGKVQEFLHLSQFVLPLADLLGHDFSLQSLAQPAGQLPSVPMVAPGRFWRPFQLFQPEESPAAGTTPAPAADPRNLSGPTALRHEPPDI